MKDYKKRASCAGALALVALLGVTSETQAQLVPDDGWASDDWDGTLPVFTDNSLDPVASGYDLTIIDNSLLTITDAFIEGVPLTSTMASRC